MIDHVRFRTLGPSCCPDARTEQIMKISIFYHAEETFLIDYFGDQHKHDINIGVFSMSSGV